MEQSKKSVSQSHEHALERFSREEIASKYPSRYDEKDSHDRREKNSIIKALAHIRPGSRVLDLPCGTGRVAIVLLEKGYEVTCGDSSEAMLRFAKYNIENFREGGQARENEVDFQLCDIMSTPFEDNTFDGIICNRLFHHFTESPTRRSALAELARISRGPIIISFFNSFALDAKYTRFANFIRRRKATDRIPIPMETFTSEIAGAGLRVIDAIPVRYAISAHWYVVAEK